MAKRAKSSATEVTLQVIEQAIHVIRGQRVMLDADLARFYGVTTSALNQAVKRNVERFPEDFAFQLSSQELTDLKSQIVTSKAGAGGRRTQPWGFTEHGVAMLSGVLRSPTAVTVNIEIMRAFVRMRRLMATPGELVEQITRLAETVQLHDGQIATITKILRQMMDPPPPPPKGRIGFQAPQASSNAGSP